jgi:hypothetical protein
VRPRAGIRGRLRGKERRSGGRRHVRSRPPRDRGGAGQLAQDDGAVGARLRQGPLRREGDHACSGAPGEVRAVGARAPEREPADQTAQAAGTAGRPRVVCRAVGGPGSIPGQVFAVLAGAPERRTTGEPAQAAGPGDGGSRRRGGDPGRCRCRCRSGGPQRRHGPQGDAAVGHRAPGALRLPRQHRVGTVEHVEQAGQRTVRAGRGRRGRRRGRRVRLAAHAVLLSTSCPLPGKVLRTRRKLGGGAAFLGSFPAPLECA